MDSSSTPNSAFKSHPTFPIAIVGGGLAGLALAIGLQKHGIYYHIYEAAAQFSEMGAGVAFGPNSTRALKLIDDRLLEGYKRHATFNDDRARDTTFLTFRYGMDSHNGSGKKAMDLMWHMEDRWAPERAAAIGVRTRSCIHRARLLDELVALLPKGVATFGKSFEGLEQLNDGTLKLRFADGTMAQASAVIGCDGIKSKVREAFFPSAQPTYVGEYAYRAMVPRAEADKALGHELAQNGQLYCGYGAYIVTYPVEHGEFTNMVAIPHDPDPKGPWTWEQDDWTIPLADGQFEHDFEGWSPVLIELLKRYKQPTIWALFNLQHSAPYYKGRVCLLGDSAHATTPHLGAGAGMAMEDAYILSNLIAGAKGLDGIENAFAAYDAVRRPRTQQLIKNSEAAGLATDFIMPGILDMPDKMKDAFEGWYSWLWHVDLEEQLAQAQQMV